MSGSAQTVAQNMMSLDLLGGRDESSMAKADLHKDKELLVYEYAL